MQKFHNSVCNRSVYQFWIWNSFWLSTTGNQHRFDLTSLEKKIKCNCGDWFDVSDKICSQFAVLNFSDKNSQNVSDQMTVFDIRYISTYFIASIQRTHSLICHFIWLITIAIFYFTIGKPIKTTDRMKVQKKKNRSNARQCHQQWRLTSVKEWKRVSGFECSYCLFGFATLNCCVPGILTKATNNQWGVERAPNEITFECCSLDLLNTHFR